MTHFLTIDYCDPDPCLNGTCRSLRSEFQCSCRSGFTGKVCDQGMAQDYYKTNSIAVYIGPKE